jgi:hypothetical protein
MGFWHPTIGAIDVLVPKTSMHEDHLAPWPKDEIGFSRKVLAVQPVAVAKAINYPPDQ